MHKKLKSIIYIFIITSFLSGSVASASFGAEEKVFLSLINDYRANAGVSRLSVDSNLQSAAEWMSNDMLLNCIIGGNSCSHTDSTERGLGERLRYFKYPSGINASSGENIAWGSGREMIAQTAFEMWKKSPGHNANMLNGGYSAIGISRSCKGTSCAWVTDFGSKLFVPLDNSGESESAFISNTEQESENLTNSFPDGSLIRSKEGIDVYIVKYHKDKKFIRLILSPSVFENYGHLKWDDVREVNGYVIDLFEKSDLVRAAGDTKVYKLISFGDNGEKRWIKSEQAFEKYGFDWNAIYEINQFDRDSYETGPDLE